MDCSIFLVFLYGQSIYRILLPFGSRFLRDYRGEGLRGVKWRLDFILGFFSFLSMYVLYMYVQWARYVERMIWWKWDFLSVPRWRLRRKPELGWNVLFLFGHTYVQISYYSFVLISYILRAPSVFLVSYSVYTLVLRGNLQVARGEMKKCDWSGFRCRGGEPSVPDRNSNCFLLL